MRGFAAYMLGGVLAVMAMNFVAPALGVGLSWPQAEAVGPPAQTVNRTEKGDRLDLPKNASSRQPSAPTALPDGCEAPVSSLSGSVQADNMAHRCIA